MDYTRADLFAKTVRELRDVARQKGLKYTGRKERMVEMILQARGDGEGQVCHAVG